MNYVKNLIKGHLNINFVKNEFSAFTLNLDEPFLNSQFFDDGNKMFRKNCNVNGGGIILYGKENTSSKLVKIIVFLRKVRLSHLNLVFPVKCGYIVFSK